MLSYPHLGTDTVRTAASYTTCDILTEHVGVTRFICFSQEEQKKLGQEQRKALHKHTWVVFRYK